MPLSDLAIRNAKSGRKLVKLSDGGGLQLLVQPRGAKLWRLAYRFDGKQKALAVGIYPVISLADARARRDAAKKLLANGVDPSTRRKLDKAANANSFRVVAEELLDKMRREGRADTTLVKTRWLLEYSFAAFGDRPIAKVSAPELLAVLRKIEARGNYETARRLRSTCGMVFRYAIATGRAERDPSVDLRGALTTPKVKHRATIIEPAAIGALLRAIDDFDGHPARRSCFRARPTSRRQLPVPSAMVSSDKNARQVRALTCWMMQKPTRTRVARHTCRTLRLTREHVRSISGYTVVNPQGTGITAPLTAQAE